MAVEELKQNDALVIQAADIVGQLEILKKTCVEGGDATGNVCCQIAITALSVITDRDNPPKMWGMAMEEQDVR